MEKLSVTSIIEEIKEEICDNYCKYTEKSWEALDQDQLYEKCEHCPLDRL